MKKTNETKSRWKCWLGAVADEDDFRMVQADDAERAASEFARVMISDGDCTECVDRYPLDVFVRGKDGPAQQFKVTVETQLSISASRVPSLHEDTE